MTTTKNTAAGVDAFAAVGNKAATENFEKAAKALGEFNEYGKENIEAVVESAATASRGVEAINARVASYSKKTVDDGVAVARRLASAKSIQEVVEVQSDFAKSSFDAYVGEVNSLADLYASAVKDAVKPLNERMTAAVEMIQGAH